VFQSVRKQDQIVLTNRAIRGYLMWIVRWKNPDSGEVQQAEELLRQEYNGSDVVMLERLAEGLRRDVHSTQQEVDGVIARYRAAHPERRRMTEPPPH
jgi:hypothetical protein